MFPCDVCGEQDFECVDGYYFCVVCYTQSQHMREETEDPLLIPRGFAIHSVGRKTDKKEMKKKDYGRPWMPHEAFLCIIKAQVEELIKMGANKRLKDVVFRLWVLYLKKTGVAFPAPSLNKGNQVDESQSFEKGENGNSRCDNDMAENIGTNEKSSYLISRHREEFFGTVEKPAIKARRLIRARKRMRAMSLKESHEEMLKNELVQELAGEQFYEGDNPLKDDVHSTATADSSDDTDSEDEQTNDNHLKKLRDKVQKQRPEWMTMLKTACFSYLGLMYTNCLTMPSDIIRWIHQRSLPFFNVQAILDNNMLFSCYDQPMLCSQNVPKLEYFCAETGKLAWFLNLHSFPEVPLPYLVQCYIHKLFLPAELNSLMKIFLKNSKIHLIYKPTNTNHSVPNYEVIAMAHIIMVMKLLFGLDDHTEKKLSRHAANLQKLIPQGESLFVWEEWLPAVEEHLYHKCLFLPTLRRQVESIQDVDEFSKHYEHCFSFPTKVHADSTYYNKSLREQLQVPFTQLRDKYCLDSRPLGRGKDFVSSREQYSSDSDWRKQNMGQFGHDVTSSSDRKFDNRVNSVSHHTAESNPSSQYTASLSAEMNETYNPNLLSTLDDDYYSNEPMLTNSHPRNKDSAGVSNVCPTNHRSDLPQCECVYEDEAAMSRFRKTTIKYLTDDLDVLDKVEKPNHTEYPGIHSYSNQSYIKDHDWNMENDSCPYDLKEENIRDMKAPIEACENYVLYKNLTVHTKESIPYHYSYKRLLNVCCHMIGCSNVSLDLELQRLQLTYIAEVDKMKLDLTRADRQRVGYLRAAKYFV